MKIVINRCHGGFGLSPLAVKRLADLNGRECYFFDHDLKSGKYTQITLEEATAGCFFCALDIANPNEVFCEKKEWSDMTQEQRVAQNELHNKHWRKTRPDDRADAKLVRVVEELGEKANGSHAKLAIVEIPDGTDYAIDEYDGIESVHETHRSWS